MRMLSTQYLLLSNDAQLHARHHLVIAGLVRIPSQILCLELDIYD
jgi:hypothetical protein